jgi:hypothetical protein
MKLIFNLGAGQALLYRFAAKTGRRWFFHPRPAIFPPMKLQARPFVPAIELSGEPDDAVFVGECAIFDSIGREFVNHQAERHGDLRRMRDRFTIQ